MTKALKEQKSAIQSLLDGFLTPHRTVIQGALANAFRIGFNQFQGDYNVKLDEDRVKADYAVDYLTEQQMGQLRTVYEGAAGETVTELRGALTEGMPLDEFTRRVSTRIKEKLQDEVITLPSGYRTTVENYVDTIVRTSVRQARDMGNVEAALSSGIIDEEWCYAISTLSENTCEFCRARHGHKIRMSDPILLHNRCECSRGYIYKEELGIPQTYTKRELDAQRKRIKKEPADWRSMQEKAALYLM